MTKEKDRGLYCSKIMKYCPDCVYAKGKEKGQPIELKIRKSKIHFCQLNRNEYKKTKVENG